MPFNADYNSGAQEGISQEQLTVADGRRVTTYMAYAKPWVDRGAIEVVSGPSEGSKTALGQVFDATAVRAAAGIKASTSSTKPLSGGQMQRLAV